MAAACALLTLPQLQVGEAAAALGDGCTTVRLAGLLGVPEDDADLAEALRRLTALVLVWPRTGGLAAAHLSEMWPHPLDLGAGAADRPTPSPRCARRGMRPRASVLMAAR